MTRLTISFTASRALSRTDVIRDALARLPDADRYVTGACTGGDAYIGRWLCYHRETAEHLVIIPADRSRVDPWWLDVPAGLRRITLTEMPPGTSYADRNSALVAEADWLSGFPAYPEDDPRSARSGSWQTIRLARRAGVTVQ